MKKRISMHDYPEHLNPFSESVAPPPTTNGKLIFPHKLNTNGTGTWTSKIAKRVSRTDSEILSIRDRYRRRSNRDEVLENVDDYKNEGAPVAPTRKVHHQILRNQEYDAVEEEIVQPRTNSSTDKDQKKTKIKKRKKRPAPAPPLTTVSCKNNVPNSNTTPQSPSTDSGGRANDEIPENIAAQLPAIDDPSTSPSNKNVLEDQLLLSSNLLAVNVEPSVICNVTKVKESKHNEVEIVLHNENEEIATFKEEDDKNGEDCKTNHFFPNSSSGINLHKDSGDEDDQNCDTGSLKVVCDTSKSDRE